MKVKIGQFEFDTDDMSSYETGNDKMPRIFVNKSGAGFIMTTRNCWETPRVRHITRAEVLRLADCYAIPGLREHLSQIQSTAPVL
jgi:hypothetical protein